MTASDVADSKPSLWRAFARPAAWTMFFFGFGSGLPFLLVSYTLAFWLKERGIDIKSITMIASAGMFYALKFLWAPLLDHWPAPFFSRLGLRRGWLLLSQVAVAAGLVTMALVTPQQLELFIAVTLFVAFCGATQDIAVDAYRIEIAPLNDQGALIATYAFGYRVGCNIIGFAFALILADHFPWPIVYAVMALFMLVPIVANFLSAEPQIVRDAVPAWGQAMREAIVDPLIDFMKRYGVHLGLALLVFILLAKIPEQATIGGIMSPFYLDMDFTKTQIGTITKFYGTWIGVAGTFAGGAAVARFGVFRSLLAAIVICGGCNLLYLLLPSHRGDLAMLTFVISGVDFALGFFAPPAVAFLSSLVNPKYTATQYALLSSFVNLPGKVLGFFAGGIVVATSYSTYFALTTLSVLPAAMLCIWLSQRREMTPAKPPSVVS